MSEPKDDKPKTLDELVLLMVSGMPAPLLDAWALKAFGEQAERMKADAKQRIHLAANYNRDELLGAAILRTQDVYARSHQAGDYKTALAAQKELGRLTRLYDAPAKPPDAAGDTAEGAELRAIREHLEPLGLAPKGYPLQELARIAAERIREL